MAEENTLVDDESAADAATSVNVAQAPEDTGDNRVPVFELHIRPMFRLIDQDHMAFDLDLWDLQSVWTNRNNILGRVSVGKDMPPAAVGGPWPDEWVAIFERWLATGDDTTLGHHLSLATPQGAYSVKPGFGGKIQVKATVIAPSPGYRVWLDIDSITTTQRVYTLVMEPPFPAQPAGSTTMSVSESFAKGTLTTLVINDANGSQSFPL
jgi:hypothetical protein